MTRAYRIQAFAPLACSVALLSPLGCSGNGQGGFADKAGGATAPVVLRLAVAAEPDAAGSGDLRYFVQQVARTSRGRLRVSVVYGVGGATTAFPEQRVARLVRGGAFDLAWIPSRAWDELGVRSLRALQTPFLITSYALLDRVVLGSLEPEMLRGLRSVGVVGLALVPGELRHPAGLTRPLARQADFAGARIHVPPSQTTDALVRALGGRPIHLSESTSYAAYKAGRVDGKEFGYVNESVPVVTANVTLFPTVLTLFGNAKAFARLDRGRRAALLAAAARTREHAARQARSEETLLRAFCAGGGRAATATPAERQALERSARPVLEWLERDPETDSLIRRIRALKQSLASPPSVAVPRLCRVWE
jgi:TRAP-type C4-dicarboxylate transport system substrate-binding protein